MRWWKVLGMAAFVGVAATGVVVVRAERRRRAYTPQEIRERLQARLAEAAGDGQDQVRPEESRPALSRLRRAARVARFHR
jgi:hypothetical protein